MSTVPMQADHLTYSQFLRSSSKLGRYTWRHKSVLQEPAMAICDAKSLPVSEKITTLVFTSESGTKSWCGSAASMNTQRKSLLDGCYD
ncbi:hypothetical protein PoB_002748000 [Plakobranchus ocellatus]|uniref:Uncharacterized protein n=1 Tax=Plakobranchus ocellatus TaxID=259542 RepID=A0AAV4A227_9GAST|nr:hypothetical protein PoB_002748000 [Plakobranchus ocellatus]